MCFSIQCITAALTTCAHDSSDAFLCEALASRASVESLFIKLLAFPADIGRKLALLARGSGQRLHTGESWLSGDAYTLANGTPDGTTWWRPYGALPLSVASWSQWCLFIIGRIGSEIRSYTVFWLEYSLVQSCTVFCSESH